MRGDGKNLQERIYDALEDGPMSVRELAQRIDASREVLSNTLMVLRRKGITRPLGPASPKVKHYRVHGAPYPKAVRDPGGYAPRKPKVERPVECAPRVPCTLAECWGWMQPSPNLPHRGISSVISGGTVRPQET